jgi:hypothetical protein
MEKVPEEWKEGIIVNIPKKGDTTNCNNWRGITLLSVPSKILSRTIFNRVKKCSGTKTSKGTSMLLRTTQLWQLVKYFKNHLRAK